MTPQDEIEDAYSTRLQELAEPRSFASGRYVARRLLGEGGQKTVFLARDTRLDRDVAVALVRTEALDEVARARVQREAQVMAGLGAQPQIVTIFDSGEDGGSPYIVSEYVAGGDLRQELRRVGGPLPIDRALAIAQDACRGLHLAHSRGILHRDIKPANVWLTEDGAAKLGDFGLAVALGRSRLTHPGTVMGTASYMAPEHALGAEADARSDLYSLGCVLYEMVTGRPPFVGDDIISIVSQHINTAPVAPSWYRPGVPQPLEALLLRLLAKAPEERPETAATVAEALTSMVVAPADGAQLTRPIRRNPLDRLAGGVFVGREQETESLRAGLDDALSGRGQLILLVGEPGIGKTRQAEELVTYARLRGTEVLWGRCYEGEGAPAFWPWIQVIRTYVQDVNPVDLISAMGPGAADIAQVVSEVRERLPDLPVPPELDPEQARFRLFDSITTFLKNLARRQPLVLVVDDLHWADRPSLLLLEFLVREMSSARLLVVATYRDVELGRQHPLSQTLGALAREQRSQRIVLRGLTEQDVARFIEITAGIQPSEGLVGAVHRETEGNAFFVKEVVSLLVSDGRLERADEVRSWSITIPQGVREVIGRRLEQLSVECNRALTIGSVTGREFGLDTLQRVSGLASERLVDVLDEAVAARVIVEAPGRHGRYSFSHALIREALHEELSTARRVRLHRQIAEALEQLHGGKPEPHLAELAYHFLEAARGGGYVEKAINYTIRAAEGALAVYAYEEAAAHYERALGVLDLQTEPREAERCELLLALGDAQWRAGDSSGARRSFEQAAAIARTSGAPDQLARAAVGFGAAVGMVVGVVDESVIALLEEALHAVGDADSALRARLLARLADEYYFSDAQPRRIQLSEEAAQVARRVRDPAALAFALRSMRLALWEPREIEDRAATAVEMLRLAGEARDKPLALTAHYYHLIDLLELGEIAAVDAEIEAITSLAEELRLPRYLWFSALNRAMRALLDGRFEQAERLANDALSVGQRLHQPDAFLTFGVQVFLLRWEQGRLHELEEVVKRFAEQYSTVPAWRCALTHLQSEVGREQDAREEFERLASNCFAAVPQDAYRSVSLALLAEVCAFLDDGQRAAALYQLLLPYAGRNAVVTQVVCLGSASRSLGLLATAMGRWEDAVQHFEDAIRMNTRMGAAPWVANAQYDYAHMLAIRNQPPDRAKARGLLAEACATAEELGMRRLADHARTLTSQLLDAETARFENQSDEGSNKA